jgi:hypothetical protein
MERGVALIETAPAHGMLVVPKPGVAQVLDEHGGQLPDASSGLEVSRGRLPQDRLVQLRFRQQLLQPGVLLLQVFEPLRLVCS